MKVLYVNLCLLAVVVCVSAWKDDGIKKGVPLHDDSEHGGVPKLDGDAIPEKKIDRRSVDLDEEEKKMEGEKPEARKRRSPQVSAPVPTGRRRRSPQSMPGMDQAMSMASSFGGRKRRSPQEEKGELESEQEAKEVEQESGENNYNNNDDDNTENENENSNSHDGSSEEEGDKKRDRRSPQDQVKQVTGKKRRSANDENHSGDHQDHKHD